MTKLTAQAAGTFAIAPTPFHDDGRIDEKSIDRLTDFYAEVGCDGVTVLGILGEAPKLDAAEAEQVAIRFVKRAKDMQIIVGVSAPGFASMRSLAKASMDAGAAGVMIAPPPHLRTDDQITGYFKQAQEAIGDIPWVLQDYPLTLAVVFTPQVIRKIVMDSPSCVMLKHEDWPGLEKISALRAFQKDGSLRPLSISTLRNVVLPSQSEARCAASICLARFASTKAFDPFGRAKRMPLSSKVSRMAAMRKLRVTSSSLSPPE